MNVKYYTSNVRYYQYKNVNKIGNYTNNHFLVFHKI